MTTLEMKTNNMSSFTHPQVVSNLYEFLSSAVHKRRYFEECWWTPLTVEKKDTMSKNGQWGPSFFKISSFEFSRRKKFMTNYDRIFIFKWTIPLKLSFAALYTHWTLMCTERHSALCGQENKIDNNIMNSWKGSEDGAARNKAKIKSQK